MMQISREFVSSKSILVCSYPTFRGLEHPRITVLIDGEIYSLQHYLMKILARCTSYLSVVVLQNLQNSPALKNITDKWKIKKFVDQ